jgi:pyruvate formate-lyase activating enzyme-like uncharacterized protein
MADFSNCYSSFNIGELARGCRLCVKGFKSVIFVTGICPRDCFYCPISDQKKNMDRVFVNEVPILNPNDFDEISSKMIEEARSHNSKGAGITGGDPLSKVDRTIKIIEILKKEFGRHYHIHLYTSLDLVSKNNLSRLFLAGLDEIRFHLDLYDSRLWDRLELAREFSWDIGIEIPLIQELKEKYIEIIERFKGVVDFFNLNELEISDTNCNRILERGYELKDEISYAIKGSIELGIEILKRYEGTNLNIHLCTASLKDGFQLRNRMLNKARNVCLKSDKISSDGMLLRGAIFPKRVSPKTFLKRDIEGLDGSQKREILLELEGIKERVTKKFGVESEQIFLDEKRLRLICSISFARANASKIKNLFECDVCLIEEYPTFDGFEVEVEFL